MEVQSWNFKLHQLVLPDFIGMTRSSDKELLLRLAATGLEVIQTQAAERREAVSATAGVLSGIYRPDELERLREDWPA